MSTTSESQATSSPPLSSSSKDTESESDQQQPTNDKYTVVLIRCQTSLHPGTYAYHVTNRESHWPKPTWKELRWSFADDPIYDGVLLGAAGVFLTTTINGYDMDLPTTSPYPRNGVNNLTYWRVKIPLTHFSDYDMSLCHARDTQVLLLLTNGDAETRRYRQHPSIRPLNTTSNKYLYSRDAQWYVNVFNRNSQPRSFFVNIFVPGSSLILPESAEWDTVEYSGFGSNGLSWKAKAELHNRRWLEGALVERTRHTLAQL